jgi:hypothetical protein
LSSPISYSSTGFLLGHRRLFREGSDQVRRPAWC